MCIFCKMVNNEIPCYKVYEDKNVLAFLDNSPVNPGHVLVIPKKHYLNLEDIPEDELMNVTKVIKIMAKNLEDKLGVSAYNVVLNNNHLAGQEVLHIHFHLIPRYKDDGVLLCSKKGLKENNIEDIYKKLAIK